MTKVKETTEETEQRARRVAGVGGLESLSKKVLDGEVRALVLIAVDHQGGEFTLTHFELGSSKAEILGMVTVAEALVSELVTDLA
jgi:hypothetical protein